MKKLLLICICLALPVSSRADTIGFKIGDFTLSPVFSNVQSFEFNIVLTDPLVPGTSYSNPALISVDYRVSGALNGTPSGFPFFALVRSIGGAEFYAQGSSMSFEIDAGADLSDGLQVSELVGTGPVFSFDAREIDTGRYHPPLFQLNADGSGNIQNSNNQGGINPATELEVNVDYGEEFITDLGFAPNLLNLFAPKPDDMYEDGFESGLAD